MIERIKLLQYGTGADSFPIVINDKKMKGLVLFWTVTIHPLPCVRDFDF